MPSAHRSCIQNITFLQPKANSLGNGKGCAMPPPEHIADFRVVLICTVKGQSPESPCSLANVEPEESFI